MISQELLRRYPFFSGLTPKQLITLANIAEVQTVEEGHRFFYEGERLTKLYFLIEGIVSLTIGVPDRDKNHNRAEQIMGNFVTEPITVSTVGSGQLFAWSSLIPPHHSTAGAAAATHSRVIVFDSQDLFEIFELDCQLGYLILQKVAGVIRRRLHDSRIESLAFMPA